MKRRDFLMAIPATLTGCVIVGGAPGAPAPAPVYARGDRWVYRGRDGFRQPVVWEEVREVISVASDGIVIRITRQGPGVDTDRTERLVAPGLVTMGAVFDSETRVFAQPLERFRFPLMPGATWRQSLANYDLTTRQEDPLLRSTTVGGWKPIATPAGSFDALMMRVLMQFNLNDPFRWPMQCNYLFGWSPAAGATVYEERYATYLEKGDLNSAIEIRAQNSTLELTSFRRGAG